MEYTVRLGVIRAGEDGSALRWSRSTAPPGWRDFRWSTSSGGSAGCGGREDRALAP